MVSEYKVEVIQVGPIEKHPKADSLSMTKVNGQTVIIKTGEVLEGDSAIYIPEDSVVPLGKVFEFLRKKEADVTARVKPVRLRGIYLEGLLVPVGRFNIGNPPAGSDVGKELGIYKYEQPINVNSRVAMRAEKAVKDPGCAPRYDVEHFLKLADLTFSEGEEVVLTEKLHGCSSRFVNHKGKFFVGSHNVFRETPFKPSRIKGFFNAIRSALFGSKKYTMKENWKRGFDAMATERKVDPWWLIAKRFNLEEKLARTPEMVIYGEIYGHVQDLTYSVPVDDVVHFAAFDVYDSKNKTWLSYQEVQNFCLYHAIPTVPELYVGPYNKSKIAPLRSGKSLIDGKTIREGFVIRPSKYHNNDRQSLKYVSEEYKLRNGETTEFH